MFSEKLSTKLILDIKSFDNELSNMNKEYISNAYEKNKDKVIEWLEKINSKADPFIFYVCTQVMLKAQQLLKVDFNNQNETGERQKIYAKASIPKLSDFIGNAQCAEIAVLGQYMLQKIDLESSYMSGIVMDDISDQDEYPENHSFIVIKNPAKPDSTYVFDIARPRSQHNIPRILETDVPLTYELLQGKSDLLIGATEVLQGGRLWLGVGDPFAGKHETVNN